MFTLIKNLVLIVSLVGVMLHFKGVEHSPKVVKVMTASEARIK